jgi:hypothetical protein
MKLKAGVSLSLLLVWLFPLAFASSRKADEQLKNLKTIHVQQSAYGKPGDRGSLFSATLRLELSRKGYKVTEDVADADAILSGTLGDVIAIDGEQPDPPQYGYQYQVASKGKVTLWRTEFKLRSRSGSDDADQKAAVRIVGGLDKAVKTAIRKTKKKG